MGWHHIPRDPIQQPVPYNFSVHKSAHPQTHPASGGLTLPGVLCCSLQKAQPRHLLPDAQSPWRRKLSIERASIPCCAPKSTMNLHPSAMIHIIRCYHGIRTPDGMNPQLHHFPTEIWNLWHSVHFSRGPSLLSMNHWPSSKKPPTIFRAGIPREAT